MFKINSVRIALAALFFAACLILGADNAFAQAQATTGQITGIVRDNRGGAIPNATIKVTNTQTGLSQTVTSSDDGLYRFVLLLPGVYNLTAEAANFTKTELKDIPVTVGQIADVNITLGVGAVTEAVTVTAVGLQTTAVQPDALFNQKSIDNLPINGRRFQDFVILTPTAIVDNATRGQISLSGQRGINSNIQIDGADYNQPFFGGIRGGERSNNGYTIPQESIQEFQVVAAGYSAEFGRSTGGVVNAITKSGGNGFHGSAFYLHRPEELSRSNELLSAIAVARNRDIPGAPTQQQWGASLGGPLKRDKAFFFGSYEQQRIRQDRNVVFTALNTLQSSATDFNGLSAPARALFDQFRALEQSYRETNDAITLLGRFDYQFGGGRFNARYNYSNNEGKNAASTGGAPDPTTNRALNNNGTEKNNTNTIAGQLNNFFGGAISNELRSQYSREERPRTSNSTDSNVNSTIGSIGARNFLPTTQFDWRVQVADNLTWIKGNHTTKFGVEYNHTFVDQVFGFNQFGTYAIGGLQNNAAGIASTLELLSGGATGAPFNPTTGNINTVATLAQQIGNLKASFSGDEIAFFAQDAWRIRPNFTLNYGLRYEAQFNPSPEANNTALVDIISRYRSPIGTGLGVDPRFIPDFTKQFAPRLGFAWDPTNSGKTVIRGDAGVYYARTPALLLAGPFNNFRSPAGDLSVTLPFGLPAGFTSSPGCATRTACDSLFEQLALIGFVPRIASLRPLTLDEIGRIATGLGLTFNSAAPTGLAPIAFANDYRNPRAVQLGIGVEREFARGFTIGADFRNVNTSRLQRNRELNLPAPSSIDAEGRPFIGTANRPLNVFSGIVFGSLQLRESTAQARYSAFTLRANLRRSWGQFSAFYTLSENMSDDDNERDAGGVIYQSTFDLGPEFNYSNLDQRHQFLLNTVFFMPYGFEVTGSARLNSARPLNATVGSDRNGDGVNNDRPFSAFGQSFKRNAFRNLAFYNVDARVQKRFGFSETSGLVISAEFFNLFNFENSTFAGPQTTYCSPSAIGCGFGAPTNPNFRKLRDASGNIIISNNPGVPFQMQLGARFQF
jgi:carboxypeptidase family protein/TonB-dependent receptor-like protein